MQFVIFATTTYDTLKDAWDGLMLRFDHSAIWFIGAIAVFCVYALCLKIMAVRANLKGYRRKE